jgi:hypothetical protein
LVRDLFLGGAQLSQRGRRDKADQEPQDREHDQKLEQCKTLLPPPTVADRGGKAEKNDLRNAHCLGTGFPGIFV